LPLERRPPPLVTAGPAGTPLAQAGVIGAPAIMVLFGIPRPTASDAGVQNLTIAGAVV
jgi:hypothetical protein